MVDQFADPSTDARAATEGGGCLCGEIRYEFPRDATISAHHCHCVDCQKSTGSGKATILFVPADQCVEMLVCLAGFLVFCVDVYMGL